MKFQKSKTFKNLVKAMQGEANAHIKYTIYASLLGNTSKELEKQINSINKIESYKDEWYQNYNNKNFDSMNKIYKNIKKEFKNIIHLENSIKEFRKIENTLGGRKAWGLADNASEDVTQSWILLTYSE